MFKHLNKIAWLIITLGLAGSVAGQEKIEGLSQSSKQAVDKLKGTPGAVSKTVQALGRSVGAKLGLGGGEAQSAKVTGEIASPAEKPNTEPPAPAVTVLGKRDPFRPFTIDRTTRRPRDNVSPLERYELGQLKLVGVIWDTKQPNAIVEDAAGLGYVIKTGTPIGTNDGKVKKIQPAGVVIEEFEIDLFGIKKKVERSMRLATEKAE
jgi:type IV pilus assembly protein PilP